MSEKGLPQNPPALHSLPTYWWRRSACLRLHLHHCYCRPHLLPRRAGRWGAVAGRSWARWRPAGPQPVRREQGCLRCGWGLGWPWSPGRLGALLKRGPRCCQGWCSGQRWQVGVRRGSWAAQPGTEGAGCCGQAWSHFWPETASGREKRVRTPWASESAKPTTHTLPGARLPHAHS